MLIHLIQDKPDNTKLAQCNDGGVEIAHILFKAMKQGLRNMAEPESSMKHIGGDGVKTKDSQSCHPPAGKF